MFGALPIIALNVYAIIDDKLNEKKKKEQDQKKKEQEEKKQNKDWMYYQRERNELGADYFSYQGYHPPKKID